MCARIVTHIHTRTHIWRAVDTRVIIIVVAAQEISDYLIARAQLPWMFDLMVSCHEVSHDDVASFRQSEAPAAGTPAVAERPLELESASAVAEPPTPPPLVSAVADPPPPMKAQPW